MLKLLILAASLAPCILADAFRESLILHPLPDGKLSVLFEFTTDFTLSRHTSGMSRNIHADCSITPSPRSSLSHPTAETEQRIRAGDIVRFGSMGRVSISKGRPGALWQCRWRWRGPGMVER